MCSPPKPSFLPARLSCPRHPPSPTAPSGEGTRGYPRLPVLLFAQPLALPAAPNPPSDSCQPALPSRAPVTPRSVRWVARVSGIMRRLSLPDGLISLSTATFSRFSPRSVSLLGTLNPMKMEMFLQCSPPSHGLYGRGMQILDLSPVRG